MNIFEKGLLTYLPQGRLQTIQSCHIGIGGCGGLGSNVAILLARCGFCRFTFMDFDKVEPSNLNRQQYILKDIGSPKALCLADKLTAINPGVSCQAFDSKWQPGLSNDPFLSCDILVEAFDCAQTKAAFVDYYSDRIPHIICGNGLAGISGPVLTVKQCGNIYCVGDKSTEADSSNPPMAPRVTQCAAMMAEIVLKLALNPENVRGSCDGKEEQKRK